MADQITTAGDVWRAMERDIEDIKNGKLPLDTALDRVAQRGRYLELKVKEGGEHEVDL
jgi:hypothetical protein